jgi:3-dehydroquinate synthase
VSLRTVEVETAPRYRVHIGPGALELAGESLARERRAAVLTDKRVAALYAASLRAHAQVPLLAVEPGEGAKSLARAEEVLEFLAGAGLDRKSTLYTLGGGVVSDLGGFAASIYMRGIQVVHCPTTLLAQADAAIGGKTAVNLRLGKNLAGSFHQPRAVFTDTAALATLDESDYRSGLGEIVKCGVIAGEAEFATLELQADELNARDPAALAIAIETCVRTKARIVSEDPREQGRRRALNLGHTFGHAIEHAAGYGVVPHGVAVAVGIALAMECSGELGLLRDPELPSRIARLLQHLGLPVTLPALRDRARRDLKAADLLSAMALDKKGGRGAVQLVLPCALGQLELGVSPPETFLADFFARR